MSARASSSPHEGVPIGIKASRFRSTDGQERDNRSADVCDHCNGDGVVEIAAGFEPCPECLGLVARRQELRR
jgi:DnaJ-class molecular chaperone